MKLDINIFLIDPPPHSHSKFTLSYASAFTTYAEWCDNFITQARTGEPYDVDHLPKLPFSIFGFIILSFGAGFVIALIATGIMRSQLKSVYSQRKGDKYIKKNSMKLTKKEDLFLYKKVERRIREKEEAPKPKSTSSPGGSTTHKSASGAKHGGKGGKF